MIVYYKLKIK